MDSFVGIWKQLHSLSHDPRVGYQLKGFVTKKRDEWFVIYCQDKIMETQEEIPAFVDCRSHHLALDGGVVLLGLVAESAAH